LNIYDSLLVLHKNKTQNTFLLEATDFNYF